MSYTVKELQEAIEETYKQVSDNNVWTDFKWEEINELDVPNFGKVEFEDSFGGEGQGDDYWVVVKLDDRYFRVDGYYSSWDGGELDGELEEVVPKEVKKIEWETK